MKATHKKFLHLFHNLKDAKQEFELQVFKTRKDFVKDYNEAGLRYTEKNSRDIYYFDYIDNNRHENLPGQPEYRDVYRFAGLQFQEIKVHRPALENITEFDEKFLISRIRKRAF